MTTRKKCEEIPRRNLNNCSSFAISVALIGILLAVGTYVYHYTDAEHSLSIVKRYNNFAQEPYKSDGLALTPPMGWNSWNYFGCHLLNESVIKGIADSMVKFGLKDAGYEYVNLDDCWQIARDNVTGEIVADKRTFPSGIPALADYVHRLGLKFGLYTDIGTKTCAKRPGSLEHEMQDVATYASWGVDFVKNDDCNLPEDKFEGNETYRVFWEAMQGQRPMVHSIKGYYVTPEQGPYLGHMRRVGDDIFPDFGSMMAMVYYMIDEQLWQYSGPGFWNDVDMLEVGNGDLSESENIAHMILWCALKAPLLLGNDLRSMTPFIQQLLTHDELLAVNQDKLGQSVELVWSGSPANGNAWKQVVSRPCNNTDDQKWQYNSDTGLLQNPLTGKCLGIQSLVNVAATIVDCDHTDQYQIWDIKENTGEMRLRQHPENCLSMGTRLFVQARVPDCQLRQKGRWKGVNKHWYPFNDGDFNFTYYQDESVLKIENLAKRCLTVGGRHELYVFTGVLSEGRYAAVLLNTDDIKHEITLKMDHFSDLTTVDTLTMRDAYLRQDLGFFYEQYTTSIEPHSAILLVLTVESR